MSTRTYVAGLVDTHPSDALCTASFCCKSQRIMSGIMGYSQLSHCSLEKMEIQQKEIIFRISRISKS